MVVIMRKSFLVGDYLPGYAPVYKFKDQAKPEESAFEPEELNMGGKISINI